MNLVMFDIDGTLTETMKVDGECFVQAFADVFGVVDINTDWSQYRHTTDSSIFREIYTSRVGQPPGPQEVSRFQEHFIGLLASASSRSPFAPIAGAGQLLSRLVNGGSYGVTLATGAWRDAARLKMASAGLCFDNHPAASADDAFERESIMQFSLQRAVERYAGPFEGVVYVGDGVWDARACRALGIPFVGIGSGDRATRLVAEGAVHVFKDYFDGDSFLAALDQLKRSGLIKRNSAGIQIEASPRTAVRRA